MTRSEFDTWFEQHYGELVAVAKAHGAPDPEGAVSSAYTVAVAPPVKSKKRTDPLYLHFKADASGDGNPWGRMSTEVRGYAKAQLQAVANARRLRQDYRAEVLTQTDSYSGRKRPAPRAD